MLFTAIADANNISKYIVEKEREFNAVKEVEHDAIVENKNVYDETVYKLYLTAEYGQTRPGLSFAFSSKEALLKEFENMQKLPFWKDKTFVEVSKEELDAISIERAKSNETGNPWMSCARSGRGMKPLWKSWEIPETAIPKQIRMPPLCE